MPKGSAHIPITDERFNLAGYQLRQVYEVLNKAGEWIDIPLIEKTLVMNIGDMMGNSVKW